MMTGWGWGGVGGGGLRTSTWTVLTSTVFLTPHGSRPLDDVDNDDEDGSGDNNYDGT